MMDAIPAITAVLAALSLILTVCAARKRSARLPLAAGCAYIAFLAGMLALERPWEEMLLSGLILLGVSSCSFRRDAL